MGHLLTIIEDPKLLFHNLFQRSQRRASHGVPGRNQDLLANLDQGSLIHCNKFLMAFSGFEDKNSRWKGCYEIDMARQKTKGTVFSLSDDFCHFLIN